MHRHHVLTLLEHYHRRQPAERARVDDVVHFVQARPDCFLRTCRPGHVTGSAWLTSADARRCVLVQHKALGRWLQPGGHSDGEPEVHRTALREAREETGMWDAELWMPSDGPRLLDVDVHRIPARERADGSVEPAHLHYDLRFWVIAPDDATPHAAVEGNAAAWFELERLGDVTEEESVLRLADKARALAGSIGALR